MKRNFTFVFLMSCITTTHFSSEQQSDSLEKGRRWEILKKEILSCRDEVTTVAILDRSTPTKKEKNNASLYVCNGNGTIEYYNRIENQDTTVSK